MGIGSCVGGQRFRGEKDAMTECTRNDPDSAMTWVQHHRESEDLASAAEMSLRLGNREKARDLYVLSARAEESALKKLHISQEKTYGITAVSAAALYFKAGQLDCAERIAKDSMAFNRLPEFARNQLRDIMNSVADATAQPKQRKCP